MAVSTFDSICRTLSDQLDKIVKTLQKAEKSLKPFLDLLDDELLLFQSSSLLGPMRSRFQAAYDWAQDNIDELVPDDLEEMATFIQSCPYLSQNELLGNAATAVKTLEPNLNEAAREVLQAFDALLDWGIAVKLNGIYISFENFKLSDVFEELDNIKLCLTGLCGYDISAKISEIDRIMTALGISSNGTFDVAQFMADIGLPDRRPGSSFSVDDVASVNLQYQSWVDINTHIKAAIDAAARSFKTLF